MKLQTENKSKKTYADYLKPGEGEPYQLINGMFVRSPSPTVNHQRLVKRIERRLIPLEDRGLGELLYAPIDVYFSETEVYQPDIIFISIERLSIIEEKKINGAPDIVIEVLSPSTGYYDLRHKMKVYESSGVNEYWIIDPPEKTIEAYSNSTKGFILMIRREGTGNVQSKLFPEFQVTLSALFT